MGEILIDPVDDAIDDIEILQESEFKLRSPFEELVHLRRIADSRELDNDTTRALLLDRRLSQAKLIDTITDDLDRTIDGFVDTLLE
jgi:hypothetical protein